MIDKSYLHHLMKTSPMEEIIEAIEKRALEKASEASDLQLGDASKEWTRKASILHNAILAIKNDLAKTCAKIFDKCDVCLNWKDVFDDRGNYICADCYYK